MEEELYKVLNNLSIEYKSIEHPPFPTCKSSEDFYEQNNMGVDCKNIFMRSKNGKKHYLVVLKAEHKIDIPKLAEFLGEHRKMGFASDERLDKYLGLKPGSVTPFALINPNSQDITVIIDKSIWGHEFIHFHPLRNTATLKISTTNFKKFLENLTHTKQDFNF